jgi:hypothetical protein
MRTPIKALTVIGIALGLLLTSGCKHYKVEMALDKDGTGTRRIELRASTFGEDDFELELDDFMALFGLTEKRGWNLKREVKTLPDETEVTFFTLDIEAKSISSWQTMSGDLDVRGTLEKGPLEDVRFHNDIEVVRSEGNTITYRERLTWIKLKERAVDLESSFFAERLADEYQFLSVEDLNDIRHFLAGMITVAWYAEEVANDDMTDEVYMQAAADYIAHMLGERYPDRKLDGLDTTLEQILDEEGDEYLDRMLKEKLPGVYLAGHTSITFTITMPGKIVESNATSVEGNTATWKYDMLLVSFNHPVELYIKSEIDG